MKIENGFYVLRYFWTDSFNQKRTELFAAKVFDGIVMDHVGGEEDPIDLNKIEETDFDKIEVVEKFEVEELFQGE